MNERQRLIHDDNGLSDVPTHFFKREVVMKTKAILMGLAVGFTFMAGSLSAQESYVLTVHELNKGLQNAPTLQQKGFFLIDVRTPEEHDAGFIPGTDRNIDYRDVAQRHKEIGANPDSHIVVYCKSGHRSNVAAHTLADLGYHYVYNLAGSMDAWNEAGYPVEFPGR